MRAVLALAPLPLAPAGAQAHDVWSSGEAVPHWVKQSCCGPADAHHLHPHQVRRTDAYYVVDGYFRPIPIGDALPSQDGEYWIFYKQNKSGGQTGVFCFFAPLNF